MATIDSLDIQISAQVNKANTSLTTLINRLDRVSASLSGVNTRGLATMGAGVNKLANAMSNFSNNTKTADFSRLSRNLASISSIDTSKYSEISSQMSQLSSAFNSFGAVPEAAQQIGEFAKNISKLGNKSVQNAITNIPNLATAMRNLMTTLSTAPAVSQNVIQMTQTLANLAAQGGRVGTASRTMVSGLNNTSNAMNRAKKSSLGLAAAFGKFYATWFLAIRGIKGFMKSVESTTDYIEAYNYYNVAFGKIASEWDKDFEKYGYDNANSYAESFTKRMNETLGKLSGVQVNLDTGLLEETGLQNLGLNIQEITQYASQLASVTNSIGQTGEVSLAAAKSMTMLAGDISSLFNLNYGDVAKNLQSALIGQSRAVYKFGLDITNATLATYAYNLGIEKSVSDMTQAEKMQLRMLAILDQSKVSWGDLANTISSPSNMLRQFKNNLKELSMVFGQLFIPVLQKIMPIVNGVTIALKRLLVSFANILGIKIDFDAFGQGYTDLGEDIDGISDSLDTMTKKAKAALRPFDELKVINMPDASAGGAGSGDMIDLTQQILDATSKYEKAWNEAFEQMENTAQEWADKIERLIEPVKKIFKDFAVGDFFQAGKDVSALVVSITDFFARAIDAVDWFGVGRKIGDFLAGIDWFEILKSVGNLMWQALKAAFELYVGAFSSAPLETALISLVAFPKLLEAITASKIVTGVVKLWKNFGIWGEKLQLVAGALTGNKAAASGLYMLYPKLGKKVDAVKKAFANFFTSVKNNGFWKTVDGGITNIRNNLGLLQKAAITAAAGFIEFNVVSDSFEKLTLGTGNLIAEIAKIGGAVAAAAAAFTLVFDFPAGIAIAAIVGVVGAIKGINDAFDQINAEIIGNAINKALSSPGGTPISELANGITEAFSTAAEGFTNLKEKSNEVDSVNNNIKSVVDEIGQIKRAMELGVLSVEEGTKRLDDLFGQLIELTSKRMSALTGYLLGLYGKGGALSHAYDETEYGAQQVTDAIIRAEYATTDAAKAIYEQMKEVDFGSSEWNSLYQQLISVSSGMEEFEQAAFLLSDKINSVEIDWEELLLPDGGLNVKYLKGIFGDISGSLEEYEKALDEAERKTKLYLAEMLTKAATPEDKALFEDLLKDVEKQFGEMRKDAESQITQFTNMLQVDYLEKTAKLISETESSWTGAFGQGHKGTFVKKAVDEYKKDFAVLQFNILTSFGELEGSVVPEAQKTMQNIYDQIFSAEYTGSFSRDLFNTEYALDENWKQIFENELEKADLPKISKEYGETTVESFNAGIGAAAAGSPLVVLKWMDNTANSIHDSAFKFGSPSKTMMQYGLYVVSGFNKGVEDNQESTIDIILSYMESIKNKFSEIVNSMREIGVNAMQGLYDGLSSMESGIYSKSDEIANNVADTIKKALEIHSPSRVMFELGDYAMQGFQSGLENLYQPILSSVKAFSYDLEVTPVPSFDDMFGNYRYSAAAFTPQHMNTDYAKNGYNQGNSETNALLRELLSEMRKGHVIELDGSVVAGRTRSIANAYTRSQGEPYFDF